MTSILRTLFPSRRALSFESVFGHDLTRETRPTNVTTETARRMLTVWACQSLISGDMASLPMDASRKTGEVRTPLPVQPGWIDAPNPLNPNYTRISYMRQVTLSLLQDGNAFIAVSPDVFDPEQLLVLNPSQVEVKDGDGMPVYVVNDRRGLELQRRTPLDLIHIPFILPPGETRGLNPIQAARVGIGIDLAAQSQASKFLDGGGLVTGVIEIPAAAGEVSQKQLDEMRESFRRRHEGPKGYSLGVLQGGAQFKSIVMSQADAQYIETRKFENEEIAGRLYLVPPFMVGSQEPAGVAYASSVERSQHYISHCLIHYAGPIELGHKRLVPGDDTYVNFNFNAFLRGDPKSRAETQHIYLQDRVVKVDQVRAQEDWAPFGEDAGGGFLETPNNTGPNTAEVIP